MIEASVVDWADGTVVGIFRFQHLPRAQEEITVPSTTDAYGFRCFDVVEVRHLAEGVPPIKGEAGPRTILRVTEIK